MSQTSGNTTAPANGQQNDQWRERELGALWLREGSKGKFFTGVIDCKKLKGEKEEVVIFKNNRKKQANHPDYILYRSEKKQTAGSAPANPAAAQADPLASETF